MKTPRPPKATDDVYRYAKLIPDQMPYRFASIGVAEEFAMSSELGEIDWGKVIPLATISNGRISLNREWIDAPFEIRYIVVAS